MKVCPPLLVPVRAPLITLYTCAALSGETIPTLLSLVEDGAIRLAFNISASDAEARCVRVATKAMVEFLEHGRKLRTEAPGQVAKEIAEWFPPLHPAERQEIDAPGLRSLFCCSQDHVTRLARIGCLRVTREGRQGKHGAAIFCRRSVVAFLEKRRITG